MLQNLLDLGIYELARVNGIDKADIDGSNEIVVDFILEGTKNRYGLIRKLFKVMLGDGLPDGIRFESE